MKSKTATQKDILRALEQRLPSFSKGQRVLARFVLDNYDKAAFMTASRLGAAVGVSESTVVRFAAELGFRGYPGMKKALQEVVRSRLTAVERLEVAEQTMNTAVDRILSARRIFIVGMRTSTTLANFLGFYLNLLRDNVHVVQDTAAMEVYEQMLRVREGDLVIGISFPRYSNRTINAMKYARDRKAGTLGITDTKTSPLNDYADVCLFAKSEMVSFLDSLVAPMGLINALIVAIGTRDREHTFQTFRDLEDIWSEYGVYQTIEH